MADTNSTFQLRRRNPADVENSSAADQLRIFLNDLNGLLCAKNNVGTVFVIGGAGSVAQTMISVVGPATYGASAQETVQCDPTGGAILINLPAALGLTGLLIEVINLTPSVNTITIQANGADNIVSDVGTTPSIVMNTPNERRYLRSNGTNAWIVTG